MFGVIGITIVCLSVLYMQYSFTNYMIVISKVAKDQELDISYDVNFKAVGKQLFELKDDFETYKKKVDALCMKAGFKL